MLPPALPHVAGDRAFHQARHAVTDPGHHGLDRSRRAAEIGEHAVGAGGQIGAVWMSVPSRSIMTIFTASGKAALAGAADDVAIG